MILGIDLHNIRDGGGVNYIRNLLELSDPAEHGVREIHLFGAPGVTELFPDRPWIRKHPIEALGRPLPLRLWYVLTRLPDLLRAAGCDVLYSPGGLAFGNFRPYVTISRNMMPFRPEFWAMYPRFSLDRFRLWLLRRANAASFERADGMIFLSETARSVISNSLQKPLRRVEVIPHGVNRERFLPLPRKRKAGRPIRIVYPSRLEPYKHQVEVVRAFGMLLREYPDLELELCGPANSSYLPQFVAAAAGVDPEGRRIRYLGEVRNDALPALYAASDLLLFASSCENLPNILIEAMASGIPICCSNRSPMPEIGKDACLYFDPTDPDSIARCMGEALADMDAAKARAVMGLRYAQEYSWDETARRTFGFIAETARQATA